MNTPNNSLKDKIVLVTGAFSGIGRATTELLMKQRAKVVAVGRNDDNEIPSYAGNYLPIERIITDEHDAFEIVEFTLDKHKRIDIVINLAGSVIIKPVHEMTAKEYQRLMQDNYFSAVNVTRAALPIMLKQKQGTMVYTPCTTEKLKMTGVAGFRASAFALQAFAHELTRELKDSTIQVKKVEFEPVDSSFWQRYSEMIDTSRFNSCMDAAESIIGELQSESSASATPQGEPVRV